MSSTLYWEPAARRQRKTLNTGVKLALRVKYGNPLHAELSAADVSYLEGLRDAGTDGVDEVLRAIETHGAIVIDEVWD